MVPQPSWAAVSMVGYDVKGDGAMPGTGVAGAMGMLRRVAHILEPVMAFMGVL